MTTWSDPWRWNRRLRLDFFMLMTTDLMEYTPTPPSRPSTLLCLAAKVSSSMLTFPT